MIVVVVVVVVAVVVVVVVLSAPPFSLEVPRDLQRPWPVHRGPRGPRPQGPRILKTSILDPPPAPRGGRETLGRKYEARMRRGMEDKRRDDMTTMRTREDAGGPPPPAQAVARQSLGMAGS